MVDAVRFPTLAAYLAQLPRGLESHPQCQAKGSQIRSALEGHDLGEDAAGLPDPIRELFDVLPPATAWVPMVYSDAVFHAVCDRFYPTEEEMLAWCHRRTMDMVRSPMYRRLVAVAGPKVFFRIADRVFFLFERGSELSIELGEREARIQVEHPANLHSRLNHLGNVAVTEAIVEITGGREPRCELVDSRSTRLVLECRWES